MICHRELTLFNNAIMYSGNNFKFPGARSPPALEDCANLYALSTSIATFINASLASDKDD